MAMGLNLVFELYFRIRTGRILIRQTNKLRDYTSITLQHRPLKLKKVVNLKEIINDEVAQRHAIH